MSRFNFNYMLNIKLVFFSYSDFYQVIFLILANIK